MFYFCWGHKFNIKALLCNTHCFYIVDGEMKLTNAQKASLHFHCNNGKKKDPQSLVTRILPVFILLCDTCPVHFTPFVLIALKCPFMELFALTVSPFAFCSLLFHFQYCFPFFKAFRPPMGATHPFIQWVSRAPSQGPTRLVSKLKASGISYIHSPA